jgi:dienelactone hydrolase
MMKRKWISLMMAMVSPGLLHGAIVEKTVSYADADAKLEGIHMYDDAMTGPRPAVLIIHQWMGITDHEKQRARMLAELGYNVFAADIYGVGVRPASPAEAGKEAGKYKSDRALFRSRLQAGLEVLRKDERTKHDKIAAIGFCFGGTAVLELARAGTSIAGVVSFHGGLDAADGMAAKKGGIPAKVLVLHGAVDPYVPADQVAGFEKEMNEAAADWHLIAYGSAVHAFTQRGAGDDPSKGAAYNEAADRRSWNAMKVFFAEILH